MILPYLEGIGKDWIFIAFGVSLIAYPSLYLEGELSKPVLIFFLLLFLLTRGIKSQRESLEENNAILNNMQDGIVVMSAYGVIKKVNPAIVREFGYGEDELIGESVKILIPPAYHEEFEQSIRDHMEGRGEELVGAERGAMRKNGSVFPIELEFIQIRVRGRIQFVSLIRDITARKREEARQAAEMEQAELFAHSINHDIRNPMEANNVQIMILKRTLKKYMEGFEERDRERLETAMKIIPSNQVVKKKILDGVRALLDFTGDNKRDPVDLNKVFQDIKQASPNLEIMGDLPTVQGNEGQLFNAFGNLVRNGIKHNSHEGPDKVVKVYYENGYLIVQDNGIGFPLEKWDVLSKIGASYGSTGGTGVGLATVRIVFTKHAFPIEIDSGDWGTKFKIKVK